MMPRLHGSDMVCVPAPGMLDYRPPIQSSGPSLLDQNPRLRAAVARGDASVQRWVQLLEYGTDNQVASEILRRGAVHRFLCGWLDAVRLAEDIYMLDGFWGRDAA